MSARRIVCALTQTPARHGPSLGTRPAGNRALQPAVSICRMKARMNKDQVKGYVKEAEGKIQQVAGKLVGDQTLEAKGKLRQAEGKTQAGIGDIKQGIKKVG